MKIKELINHLEFLIKELETKPQDDEIRIEAEEYLIEGYELKKDGDGWMVECDARC